MSKIKEAQDILKELGLPLAQQNETAALTLLALCDIKEVDSWSNANAKRLGLSKGIMKYISEHYSKTFAANTRETIRKDILHFFVQANLAYLNPDNPSLPVNSPKTHYAISDEALSVIKSYNTRKWKKSVAEFKKSLGSLTENYQKRKNEFLIPITLPDGNQINLSPGEHNELQKAIIEKFAPRFATGSVLLYIGDTAKKDLKVNHKLLEELMIPIDQHSKLPDVVLYDRERNWLFLIEAVTSRGPVSPKRFIELEKFLSECLAGKIYVTAFLSFSEFKKHSSNISWETEVWISENPDHMIHYNGDRFMGPR